MVQTLKNALLNGGGVPVKIRPGDFAVYDSEHTTRAATVLLLDMSWSMQAKNFEDLEIWKIARLLTRGIYQLTKDSKFAKDFALRVQIRRAAVSIMSNPVK